MKFLLQPNHLIGLKQKYLKLSFVSITELLKVRRDMLAAVKKSKERAKTSTYYTEMMNNVLNVNGVHEFQTKKHTDQFENIVDIR